MSTVEFRKKVALHMTLSARSNIVQLTGCKEGSLLLLANGKGEPLKITASIREKKTLIKSVLSGLQNRS